jgi:AcrR family transcriptional regulator
VSAAHTVVVRHGGVGLLLAPAAYAGGVTPRPPAARLPAARRRQQLLEVALHVFGDEGFHVASMNDVAEAAGVTKPVLYQHFRSKRDLYREVLTDVGNQLLDAITKATAAARTPHEQVELGFEAYFRFVATNQAAFRVLFGGGTRRDEEFAAQVAEVEGAIAEAIATLIDVEGLTGPERRQLAHGLVGLAEGTSRLWVAEGAEEPPEQLARLLADLAWRGLRGVRGV